ncbi:hypothetical protein QQF64_013575 [Cirrhinus molitorella]|uniref:Uncharacterized protein n=1 Tax=Cirrhinus molitorella TaxID=172907 RepID=A0ABR3LRJ7_9TELE
MFRSSHVSVALCSDDSSVTVGSGFGPGAGSAILIDDFDEHRRCTRCEQTLDVGEEALSKTFPGQLRFGGRIRSTMAKVAKASIWEVRVYRQERKVVGVVLETAFPLQ